MPLITPLNAREMAAKSHQRRKERELAAAQRLAAGAISEYYGERLTATRKLIIDSERAAEREHDAKERKAWADALKSLHDIDSYLSGRGKPAPQRASKSAKPSVPETYEPSE